MVTFGATVVTVELAVHEVSLTDASQVLTIHSCLCRSYPSEHRLTASHQLHSKPIFAVRHESQLCNEAHAMEK